MDKKNVKFKIGLTLIDLSDSFSMKPSPFEIYHILLYMIYIYIYMFPSHIQLSTYAINCVYVCTHTHIYIHIYIYTNIGLSDREQYSQMYVQTWYSTSSIVQLQYSRNKYINPVNMSFFRKSFSLSIKISYNIVYAQD